MPIPNRRMRSIFGRFRSAENRYVSDSVGGALANSVGLWLRPRPPAGALRRGVEPAPDLDELALVEGREALVTKLGQPALALLGVLEREEVLLNVGEILRRKIRTRDQLLDRHRLALDQHLSTLVGVLLDHR